MIRLCGRNRVIDAIGIAWIVAMTLGVYALGVRHASARRAEAQAARARAQDLETRLATLTTRRDRVRSAISRSRNRLDHADLELEPLSTINSTLVSLAEAAERHAIQVDQLRARPVEDEELYARVPIRLVGRGEPEAVAPLLNHLHEAFPAVAVETFSVEASPLDALGGNGPGGGNSEAGGRVALDLAWYADPAGAGGD